MATLDLPSLTFLTYLSCSSWLLPLSLVTLMDRVTTSFSQQEPRAAGGVFSFCGQVLTRPWCSPKSTVGQSCQANLWILGKLLAGFRPQSCPP